MKSMIRFLFVLVLLFSVSDALNAQVRAEGTKFGIQLTGMMPLDDFGYENDLKPGYVARALLRFELAEKVDLELGAGFAKYSGSDYQNDYYRSDLIPIDLRFVLYPKDFPSWSPYFFAGGGLMHYEVKDFPYSNSIQNPYNEVEADGWTGIIPAGVGGQFRMSETVLLDVQASLTYSFTENLNFYNVPETPNDAYYGIGVGLVFQSDRGDSDDDQDGLTKNEEEALQTDPNNPDTDGDGLIDGAEVNTYGTNPLLQDSDRDNLLDGEEVRATKTNPAKADTDNDNLNDGDEVNSYKTDPLDPDTDGDGLEDGEEVNKYGTDPKLADTDKDGLTDGDEVNKYKTDPLKADTDGEGLTDGAEINIHGTDPLKADTDGGTIDDFTEVNRKTNPKNPKDDIILDVSAPIVLEGVTFETGSSKVTEESAEILQKALNTLEAYPEMEVEIHGHTDNVGSRSFNMKLSEQRAESVKAWLVERGIDGSRITAKGFGPDNPVVPNDTPENRTKNRRIEFVKVK